MGRKLKSRTLLVLMNGELVGEWKLTSTGSHEFLYAESWLSSPFSRPLSLSIPLREERYSGDIVHSFFDNLLPDNDAIRRRIRDRFATGSIDAFQLLAEIGRDCVGAIQILPDGDDVVDVRKITAETVTDADIELLIARAVTSDYLGRLLSETEEFRISIAGAQEKTALLWHEGQWKKPTGATPTTHILKLPLGQMGHFNIDMTLSVENEWLCSRILQAYGISVAASSMIEFGNTKTLVVERFDRRLSSDKSWIIRLPQEDMCQATGTPSGLKYESDGGPGIRPIMNLLLGSSRAEEDRKAFFRAQVAFWLLCAIDGHAKNFSIFIDRGGSYNLTPLYDVLSAYPVMGSGTGMLSSQKVKMAMALRGKNKHYLWNTLQKHHFLSTATRCGFDASSCADIIGDMISKTPAVIDRVSNELPPGFPAQVADSIFKGLKQSAAQLS
ncbi:MAG: type II toxin-antitoxin system HipA family toxin [Chlorobiaceae bacterium]|nr:type II toxin-antitoxin system HipA family toxin [Chlorobiaceae bacterium]